MTGHPEGTAEAFRHGWFHTGDLGWVDGENVASLEVELAVAGHPEVAECVVVGLPHERWTEAVTAFVRRGTPGVVAPVSSVTTP